MATEKLITPVFRVSFPNVFEASSYQGGPPKYGVTAVFDPDSFSAADKKRWAAMQKLANDAAIAEFGKPLDKLPANVKRPLRDGEEKAELEGFGEGLQFASLTTKFKPEILDTDRESNIIDAEDFYPGCYARASVNAYGYDNVGKGVAFGLMSLMKVKDGDRLDNRTSAADDFADLGEEDDASDLE